MGRAVRCRGATGCAPARIVAAAVAVAQGPTAAGAIVVRWLSFEMGTLSAIQPAVIHCCSRCVETRGQHHKRAATEDSSSLRQRERRRARRLLLTDDEVLMPEVRLQL